VRQIGKQEIGKAKELSAPQRTYLKELLESYVLFYLFFQYLIFHFTASTRIEALII
jgi:hypothetical protein